MYIRRSPIWPDPRVKPPLGAVQINWGHPLAYKLQGYWLFQSAPSTNLARVPSGLLSTPVGATSGTFESSPMGAVYAHTATTDRLLLASDSSLLLTAQEITIALRYRKRDGTSRESGAFGISPEDSPPRCGVHLPWSDGIVYWDFGGTTEDSTRESVGGLTVTGIHTWVFTSGPRGMEIWQDGILRSSNTANPSRTQDATKSYLLGFHGGAASDLAEYDWFYLSHSQLAKDLCVALSLENYAFLQPVIRRRVSLPAAAVTTKTNPALVGSIAGWW